MRTTTVQPLVGAVIAWLCLAPFLIMDAMAGEPQAPAPGMVTMVDIGAKTCVPCKMMTPILDQLKKEYQGKAAILFIDVWEDPAVGEKYGIKLIPTQIFYNAEGKEILRHEGFLDKAAIVSELQKLGVE